MFSGLQFWGVRTSPTVGASKRGMIIQEFKGNLKGNSHRLKRKSSTLQKKSRKQPEKDKRRKNQPEKTFFRNTQPGHSISQVVLRLCIQMCC
jgi:hypothetical protein